jgi:nicotinamidase-related amidase
MPQPRRFNSPELLDGLRKRDRQLWETFYEEQWQPLCRFIQARLPNSAKGHVDSEDSVQEVLCRAYTGISHFRGEACIETWLNCIAHHVIVDTVRMVSLRQRLSEGSGTLESVREVLHAHSVPDPEACAVQKDVLRKLLQELETVLGKYSGMFIKRHLSAKRQSFAKGTGGGEWHPDFAPQPSDIIIKEHWGQSGFANTDLDFRLKQQGIIKVIVIGLLANTCIESTSRFAMELGYHVTLVKDATAAFSQDMMHAAHELNGPSFAHAILTTAELVAHCRTSEIGEHAHRTFLRSVSSSVPTSCTLVRNVGSGRCAD